MRKVKRCSKIKIAPKKNPVKKCIPSRKTMNKQQGLHRSWSTKMQLRWV